MSKRTFLIFTILFSFSFGFNAIAQNPSQMKKQKKANKKKQKAYKKPLEYETARKDSDGDGVMDYSDHCLNTPKGQPVTPFGCPIDRDFDGTVDTLDHCIDVPGPKDNFGCPLPDTDGDGIVDRDDKCPNTPGVAELAGCPDRDGDGVADSEDDCPDVFGSKAAKGCPDRDGDGILDKDDECPKLFGTVANKGCPEIKEEEKKAIEEAFHNLLFESGKAVIKSSSYPSLNHLAEVMVNNPKSKLILEGHTDNVGEEEANQKLSEDRAKAVKTYLTKKMIADSRITTNGFGESKPITTNETPEGKAKNRRVEFIIKY